MAGRSALTMRVTCWCPLFSGMATDSVNCALTLKGHFHFGCDGELGGQGWRRAARRARRANRGILLRAGMAIAHELDELSEIWHIRMGRDGGALHDGHGAQPVAFCCGREWRHFRVSTRQRRSDFPCGREWRARSFPGCRKSRSPKARGIFPTAGMATGHG